MRRLATLILFAVLTTLGWSTTAAAHQYFELHDAYTCDMSFSYNAACAVIDNKVRSWEGTAAEPQFKRGLVFVAPQASYDVDMAAQRRIEPEKTGDAIIGRGLGANADGAVTYGLSGFRYRALVTMRMSSDSGTFACIEMSYLKCEMGSNIGTSGDPRHRFTISSRPVEVKVVNDMPVALRRVDGPYLSNMLGSERDTGAVIQPGASGAVGTLRSVVKTSAFAAVYKFARSAEDPRYNAASVLISVRVTKDGTDDKSKCTAVYLKSGSGAPFTCTVNFLGTSFLTALVRVSRQ